MDVRLRPSRSRRPSAGAWLILAVVLAVAAGLAFAAYRSFRPSADRLIRLRQYWADPERRAGWTLHAGSRCGDAPFLMPTDGLVGFLWDDAFYPGHRHQGVDIFGPTGPDGLGETRVVAVHDGYLTRLPEWKSAVILRIPSDPLMPGRQIWVYDAHMADADGTSYIGEAFPPGTTEAFVPAGTLLGFQGNYSADPDNPTGMHLHFSIVEDDGQGRFRSELQIANTLDPSPYLGVELNASRAGQAPAVCSADP